MAALVPGASLPLSHSCTAPCACWAWVSSRNWGTTLPDGPSAGARFDYAPLAVVAPLATGAWFAVAPLATVHLPVVVALARGMRPPMPRPAVGARRGRAAELDLLEDAAMDVFERRVVAGIERRAGVRPDSPHAGVSPDRPLRADVKPRTS